MAEIKSTLDLVMERTRHMKQTSAEKESQRLLDFQKAASGVIRKFIDNLLDAREARKEFAGLKADFGVADDAVLIRPVLEKIGLDQDNRAALTLLKDVCGASAEGITAVLEGYRARLAELSAARTAELLGELAASCGVSGAAAVPNLAADAVWADRVSELRASFADRLDQEKRRLG